MSRFYNHRPIYARTIATHCRRDRTEVAQKVAKDMRNARAPASETFAMLQGLNAATLITRKDVNNEKQRDCLEQLATKSQIERLYELFKQKGYIYVSHVDPSTN